MMGWRRSNARAVMKRGRKRGCTGSVAIAQLLRARALRSLIPSISYRHPLDKWPRVSYL